jgi:tRNA (guanine37-N1)-methyltransferase
MKFDVVTIFPEFFAGPFHYGIVRRAREAGLIDIRVHDLRQFAHDRHKTVDDRPFGGGEGMVFKPEPMFEAVETILSDAAPRNPEAGDSPKAPEGTAVVLLSASGKIFVQEMAERFAKLDRMVLLCGRYEGVDERVAEHLADEELSIGDYVLSGGELAAAVVVDAVARLQAGVLGNETSSVDESFGEAGLLDWPQYTRPAEFRGWKVPEVLIGGNHEEVRKWRRNAAREKTQRQRPDLLG